MLLLPAEAPKFHNAQFAYGRFLLANHQDDKALQAFEREIANTPNHLLARLGIAGIKSTTDPAAGLPYAQQAVKLAPKLAEAHYLLGATLLATGDTGRAIQELEVARQADPAEPKVYLALGNAYAAAGRAADAARVRTALRNLQNKAKSGQ